jgi:hypothetical protein
MLTRSPHRSRKRGRKDLAHRAQAQARQARYRQRRDAGIAVIAVEIDHLMVDMLVTMKWLDRTQATHSTLEIRDALQRMLRDASRALCDRR